MSLPIILLAFANAEDSRRNFLDELTEEQIRLDDLLHARMNVEQKPWATLKRIQASFDAHRPHIKVFHFGGHASPEKIELNQGIDGHSGGYARGIAQYVGRQEGVELVFLNGCETDAHAHLYIDAGIPAVIATTREVGDQLAREFAEIFYTSFVHSQQPRTLENAFQDACDQLAARYQQFDSTGSRGLIRMEKPDLNKEAIPYVLRLKRPASGRLYFQDWEKSMPESEEGDLPERAHLLVNRDDPDEDFADLLTDNLTQKHRSPVVCFVQGSEEELPLSLCERFYYHSVERVFKRRNQVLKRSCFMRYEVNMPLARDFQKKNKAWIKVKESLLDGLRLSLAAEANCLDLQGSEVVSQLGKHLEVVLFHHNLYEAEWDPEASPEFLRSYLQEFWPKVLPTQGPEIILLFNLQYTPRKGIRRMFKKTTSLLSSLEEFDDQILTQLSPVVRSDVKRWVDHFFRREPGLVDQIFKGKSRLPMKEILPFLEQKLKKIS